MEYIDNQYYNEIIISIKEYEEYYFIVLYNGKRRKIEKKK